MARHVIFNDEMQEADALEVSESASLVDTTSKSERIVYIDPKADNEIIVFWEYFRHRIPADTISMPPDFLSRDSKVTPPPSIRDVALLPDKCGVRFVIPAGTAKPDDSWVLNCQAEGTYFNEMMGRTYTHRRILTGVIVSTKEKTEDYLNRVYATAR